MAAKKKIPSDKKKKSATKSAKPPELLVKLLEARSPTGSEFEAQRVLDKYIKPVADTYASDALGNRIATLNPKGDPTLMLAGHMDELGLIVRYVDSNGFVFFDGLGGHDRSMISGRRVAILTEKGPVEGVTGKRAVHLMSAEDRKKVPEMHQIWIDLGVASREEALKLISIGDPVVYDHAFRPMRGSVCVARAFDNKAGCYVVNEVLRRLADSKAKLAAKVVSVSTTQEEIGTRGATTSAFAVDPQIAIAVDVGHATDSPDCDPKKYGEFKLGGGPILGRGPNINPLVFGRLRDLARSNQIPFQVEAEPRPTGTDARAIQMARGGVATGLISLPLRYMHTPSEVCDLEDFENAVKLIGAFAQSLKKGERMAY
ncbi:MAG: M42 family metallopeptidase [Opitutales bacterium]